MQYVGADRIVQGGQREDEYPSIKTDNHQSSPFTFRREVFKM